MNKQFKLKKISKLFRNPNLFFYDMFRKRIYKNPHQETKKTSTTSQSSSFPTVDIIEIQRIGLNNYIRKNLNSIAGPKDGFDPNSLLIWSGYLNGIISFLAGLKEAMSMNITIYTLNGRYNLTSKLGERFDIKNTTRNLNSATDFVVETNNLIGQINVLHIYLFDINATGIATVRSNRALIKRFELANIHDIFSKSEVISEMPKVDAVYTWVNHQDLDWQNYWQSAFPEESFDPDRYTDNDELKYSLRSLNKYAPWLNKIYVVTNCKKPSWLNDNQKVIWISHEEIFPDKESLPTFSSHSIETCLHRINGLSENFIYFNDDVILGQPCLPSDFFDDTGRSISYLESYGMVDSIEKNSETPDYLVAAKNSQALLKSVYPHYVARRLHKHVPFALKRSTLEKIEDHFFSEINKTRNSKKRSEYDINLTSFFYHHYSYINGLSIQGEISSLIVRPRNINTVISKDSFKYKFLCFNDGNGSAQDDSYKKKTQMFLDKRFPEKAEWENS
ncbi:stealth conserved region 3 domain-containing protein [Yersinia intermedia]|uniref:stealth conserved region 3 domain-containing protein n=1 Tax=Yersinia intermedia TaxID=631 RepID=UPI001CFE01E1|nr:stealth conserved region 3 domain-containing protein [Yersinia intermedia]MCB5322208.1 stealth conserved region 3 domain-containing protein [Yersinia intermedia]